MFKTAKTLRNAALVIIMIFAYANTASAQKVGFISSEDLREYFPEARQADARIQSIVNDWKLQLESMKNKIEDLEFDIKKNRLIWSDEERTTKQNFLEDLRREHVTYAKSKFEAGGKYDEAVESIMVKVEEKIYAAVQNVAASEGYDIIWDKSIQPLAYVNFKYDLTVKVLRKLGVDVKQLEKDLAEKIKKDPRNKSNKSKEAPKRSRSRRRTTRMPDADQTIQKEAPTEIKKEEIIDPTKPQEPAKIIR